MKTQRVYRTEAVVLKGYNYGEADRILTLLTPHYGKVRAVAKGVRRTKSRMAGHVDLFTRSTVLLARGRQLDIITQAESIDPFQPVRGDLTRLAYCHYIAELLDGFSVEALPDVALFDLGILAFRRLAEAGPSNLVVRSFELALLANTGFRPQLHRCLKCDAMIYPEANRFSSKLGGVLCPMCAGADATAPRITVPALKLLRNLQTNDTAVLEVSDIQEDVIREVQDRLEEYVAYRLESQPRSLKFLERLRSENVS